MLISAHNNKEKHFLALLFVTFLATMLVACVAFAAHAAAPVSNCKTADGQDGIQLAIGINGTTCEPISGGSLQTNPIFLYTIGILKIVSGLAGLATVGGMLWGGIMYITARANEGQVEKAKLVMINSIIGLLLFIFMYAILQFLVPGGIFG